jgi:hypothetical protein
VTDVTQAGSGPAPRERPVPAGGAIAVISRGISGRLPLVNSMLATGGRGPEPAARGFGTSTANGLPPALAIRGLSALSPKPSATSEASAPIGQETQPAADREPSPAPKMTVSLL